MTINVRYLTSPAQYFRLGNVVDQSTPWAAQVGDTLVDAGRSTYKCTGAGVTATGMWTSSTHTNTVETNGSSTWTKVTPDSWANATYLAYLDEPVNAVWYVDANAVGYYSIVFSVGGGDATKTAIVYVDPATMKPKQAAHRPTVSTSTIMSQHDAVFFADAMRQPSGYHSRLTAAGEAIPALDTAGTYYQIAPKQLIDGRVNMANNVVQPTSAFGELVGVTMTGGTTPGAAGQGTYADASTLAPYQTVNPLLSQGFASVGSWSLGGIPVYGDRSSGEGLPTDLHTSYPYSQGSHCSIALTSGVYRTGAGTPAHSYSLVVPADAKTIAITPFFTVLAPPTGARTVRAHVLCDGGYGPHFGNQDLFMEVFYPNSSGFYSMWSGHDPSFFLPWVEGTPHALGSLANWSVTGYFECLEYLIDASITIGGSGPLYVRFTVPQNRSRVPRANVFICPYIEVI
jgi:hypothetical protein